MPTQPHNQAQPRLQSQAAAAVQAHEQARLWTRLLEATRMNPEMHANAAALITPQQAHMPTATTLITTARLSTLAAESDSGPNANNRARARARGRVGRGDDHVNLVAIHARARARARSPAMQTPAAPMPAVDYPATGTPLPSPRTRPRSEAPQSPRVPAASTGGAAAKGAL